MQNAISRRRLLQLTSGGIAAAALTTPSILRAQGTYPDRPVNIIVPFATGGYNDRLARAFSPFLQAELGQPCVIVNQPGAGAQLGHTYALQQPNDGYTILCTSAAPYIPLNILLQNAPFKAEDFHMINLPSRDFTLAATTADSEIADMQDVINRLKEDPTSLSIGVQPASADYANLILTLQAAGVPTDGLRLVTYDGGGPTRNATAGGQVDVGFVGGEGFLPLKDKIKPLAMYTAKAPEWWPDIPTIADAGIETEFVEGSQRGWAVATALTTEQPEIYATIEGAVQRATENPECVKTLETQELSTTWYGPEESNAAFMANYEKMASYVDLLK